MDGAPLAGHDRFDLIRRLGAGGMGEVWEAHDRQRDVRVAVKTLTRATPEHVLRLKQEFRVAHTVSHHNVVTLGELFHHGGVWFFSMELIEGVSFLDHVRPGGILDIARLRACLPQLIAAVDALHAVGVLHRDLKPSNVMVARDGRLVVLDLGLVALPGDEAVDERAVLGTPVYMAPEQAAAGSLGPPADWYAVGAILYHALANRPPFAGDAVAILVDKQRRLPPPLAGGDDGWSDLAQLAMGLLAIEARERPDPRLALGGAKRDSTASTSLDHGGDFVGRDIELAMLDHELDAIRGRPRIVVVTGESGVGKSALVRHFGTRAMGGRDALILRARCHERESVPGGGIDGIMDSLARHLRPLDAAAVARCVPRRADVLVRAFPVLRTVGELKRTRRVDDDVIDPHTRRARVVEAIGEMLARIADRRLLVVVVDDVQWADAETLATLHGVVSGPDPPPLLLIATWRALASGAVLPPLLAGGARIDLAPLASAEAAELARSMLARVGDSTIGAAELARESRGHPLLLDVLIDHHLRSKNTPARGVSLREALGTRVEALDGDPRAVLDAIAVAGAPVGERILSRVTGLAPVRIARAVATLRSLRLVRHAHRDDATLIEAYHHQVSTVVLGLLEPAASRGLHATFADALEAGGDADPEVLAAHLRSAGDLDAAARYAAVAAAAATAALAFHRAARLWGLAIELGGAGRMDECHLGRADALAAIGRGADAAADFLAVASRADPVTALELRRHAAQQLLVTGHTADGLAQIREILELEGLTFPATPRRAVAWVIWRRLRLRVGGAGFRVRDPRDLSPRMLTRIDVCWHVALGLSIVDTMRGQAFHALGLRMARAAGEPRRYARALALDVAYRSIAGAPVARSVEAQFEVAHKLAIQLGDDHARGVAIGCRGIAALLRGDWRDAAVWCDEAGCVLTERCAGVPWELATAKIFAGRALLALGELDRLAARVDADLRDCRGRGDLFGETSLRAALVPFVYLARGELAAAREAADSALAQWTPIGYQIQHYYQLVSRCAVFLYDGTVEAITAAVAALRDGRMAARRSMFLRFQIMRATLDDLDGRVALATGGLDTRRIVRAAARLERERLPWTRALAAALRAGAAHRGGDAARARRELERAVVAFDGAAMAMHAAAARRRLAELVGGDAGAALRDTAEQWMARQRVADPARLTAMLLPW